MHKSLFVEFMVSGDVLRVYHGGKLIYSSSERMLLPLLRYIKEFSSAYSDVVVYDKIVGRAAAFLLVIARCKAVYSPLASELAIKALKKYGITYEFSAVVPYIQRAGMEEMCPMEKMSSGCNSPQDFYARIKDLV